ncbi:MAG: TetR/AcrR family transcriptional regulator [Cohaesibacter sp.]|nr:TetR/AcrR family transcriptional regulator [Cohaesibacter sp.]
MNEREKSIAAAAIRMYVSKGVRRTTMSDVAGEAGVTRQTVYNTFANTDAVLRGAILFYVDELWQNILTEWGDSDGLDQKLDILLHYFAVVPWDFLNSSEEAAQLERGYNAAGRAAVEEARLVFQDDIAALFMPWQEQLACQGTTPRALSDFISAAIEGIKYNNETRQDMLLAVATLKACLIALTK